MIEGRRVATGQKGLGLGEDDLLILLMGGDRASRTGNLLKRFVQTTVRDAGKTDGIHFDGRHFEARCPGCGHFGDDCQVAVGWEGRVETDVDNRLIVDVHDLRFESLARIDGSRRLVERHVDDGRRPAGRRRPGSGGDPLVHGRSGVHVRIDESGQDQASGSIDDFGCREGGRGGLGDEPVRDPEPAGLQDAAVRKRDVAVHGEVVSVRVVYPRSIAHRPRYSMENRFRLPGPRRRRMLESLFQKLALINSFLWGPWTMGFLAGVAVFFTVRSGFFQVTGLGYIVRNTVGRLATRSAAVKVHLMSPVQAAATSLAGTVGMGNMAGVATALSVGGAAPFSGCG